MRWLSLLAAAIGLAAVSDAAFALPQPDAEAAYARGDFVTAFNIWLPLAERGSVQAQLNIARMYERGEGVAQDKQTAQEWYRRAAEQHAQDAAMASVPMGSVATDTADSPAPPPVVARPASATPPQPAPPVPATYPAPVTYPSPAPYPVSPSPAYIPIVRFHFHHRH
jgi:hypothetical protein